VPDRRRPALLPAHAHRCYSRYLLRCEALPSTDERRAREVLESAFREFGLPARIRSDHGSPFASTGAGGLTRLSVWWVKLGIVPERIRPGQPQENGRLERFHGTLKRETASPPRASMRAQQRAFDIFRPALQRRETAAGAQRRGARRARPRSNRTHR
jgi:transposase InsO family protein